MPTSFFKNNAEFHWLELTVKFAGRVDRCRFGPWLAVDRSFECASSGSVANPPGAQDFTIESQMCFDVKDDGDPAKCTPWSTLTYTD